MLQEIRRNCLRIRNIGDCARSPPATSPNSFIGPLKMRTWCGLRTHIGWPDHCPSHQPRRSFRKPSDPLSGSSTWRRVPLALRKQVSFALVALHEGNGDRQYLCFPVSKVPCRDYQNQEANGPLPPRKGSELLSTLWTLSTEQRHTGLG